MARVMRLAVAALCLLGVSGPAAHADTLVRFKVTITGTATGHGYVTGDCGSGAVRGDFSERWSFAMAHAATVTAWIGSRDRSAFLNFGEGSSDHFYPRVAGQDTRESTLGDDGSVCRSPAAAPTDCGTRAFSGVERDLQGRVRGRRARLMFEDGPNGRSDDPFKHCPAPFDLEFPSYASVPLAKLRRSHGRPFTVHGTGTRSDDAGGSGQTTATIDWTARFVSVR